MGIFIQISVQADHFTPEQSQQLVQLCPVDIFELREGELQVNPNEEDECTLCGLCLSAVPQGAITIYKTYSGERLISG